MSIWSACVDPAVGNQSICRQISTPITDATTPISEHPRERVLLVRRPLLLGRAQSARESIQLAGIRPALYVEGGILPP